MSRFEYVIPGETTVKRLFTHDEMSHDLFAIEIAGVTVTTVTFATAREYWRGTTTLAAILEDAAIKDAE